MSFRDSFAFSTGNHTVDCLTSSRGAIAWLQLDETPALTPALRGYISFRLIDNPFDDPELKWKWRYAGFGVGVEVEFGDCQFLVVPYWALILPLVAITACLLLGKQRQRKWPATLAAATDSAHELP